MSIEQISQQSKVDYQASQTRSQRVIEIKKDDPRHSSRDGLSGAQKIAMDVVDFSSKAISVSHQEGEPPEHIYPRPLSVDILRTKILLEEVFDVKIEGDNEALAKAINEIEVNGQSFAQGTLEELPTSSAVLAFGQSFDEDSELVIMNAVTDSQSLNYSTSGTYKINDKVFHSTFELSLSEQRTSMTEATIPAISLKDPLLLQFGPQAIGQLNGQKRDVDINSDGVIDSLPMFEGDVGYLVHDKNNNGRVDDGSELFGPQSGNGFSDLRTLDSNGNGFFDREDEAFSELKIWQVDASGSESWRNLADTDIHAINLAATSTPFNFYDKNDELQAKLTRTSVALTEQGKAYGVHQVDVRI